MNENQFMMEVPVFITVNGEALQVTDYEVIVEIEHGAQYDDWQFGDIVVCGYRDARSHDARVAENDPLWDVLTAHAKTYYDAQIAEAWEAHREGKRA